MNVRPFQSGDLKFVADIYALSKLDELRFEDEKFELLPLAQDEKRLGELLESQIYICELGDILGYGAVYGSEIRSLFVHPNARGRGVGGKLLEYMLSTITFPAHLYVVKSNAPAKALYERYGFAVTGEFETSYNGKPVVGNEMKCTVNRWQVEK